MLKKVFASIGIGAAQIDAVLEDDHIEQGSEVRGYFDIRGGDVEQEIDHINLNLMTRAKTDEAWHSVCLASMKVAGSFKLQPAEQKRLPFSFRLHPETPITALELRNNQSVVWLQSSLDIDNALDPTDKDYLWVYPSQVVRHFMTALEEAGFGMVKADVEKGYLRTRTFASRSGCYQELEYRPLNWRSGTREIELSFVPDGEIMHCLIEVDRGFMGDGYVALSVPASASLLDVKRELQKRLG
ncbi:sporulation protein [Kiloniella sp. b19]|uniref:sporulation protein n=1 Tax=Kiloniella sp. GXU_MW_B19 TaxID=3141326 RepID=UPI0031CF75BB